VETHCNGSVPGWNRTRNRPGNLDLLLTLFPGNKWIPNSIPASRTVLALRFIHLATGCPGPYSRRFVGRIVVGKSLKMATFSTLCVCIESVFLTYSRRASPIAHSSASHNSFCPVPWWLRKAFQRSPFLYTAPARTLSSSDHDLSVHQIQTPGPTLASLSLAQRVASYLATSSSLSMTALPAGFPSGVGQRMVSASQPHSCSFVITLHIGAPDMVWSCIALSLEPL